MLQRTRYLRKLATRYLKWSPRHEALPLAADGTARGGGSRFRLLDATLMHAFFLERVGIEIGVRMADVLRHVPAFRPYEGPSSQKIRSAAEYTDQMFFIFNLLHVLSNFGELRLSPALLPAEHKFVCSADIMAHAMVAERNVHLVGGLVHARLIFGETEAQLVEPLSWLIGRQLPSGGWPTGGHGAKDDDTAAAAEDDDEEEEEEEADPYTQYHAATVSIMALLQPQFRGWGPAGDELLTSVLAMPRSRLTMQREANEADAERRARVRDAMRAGASEAEAEELEAAREAAAREASRTGAGRRTHHLTRAPVAAAAGLSGAAAAAAAAAAMAAASRSAIFVPVGEGLHAAHPALPHAGVNGNRSLFRHLRRRYRAATDGEVALKHLSLERSGTVQLCSLLRWRQHAGSRAGIGGHGGLDDVDDDGVVRPRSSGIGAYEDKARLARGELPAASADKEVRFGGMSAKRANHRGLRRLTSGAGAGAGAGADQRGKPQAQHLSLARRVARKLADPALFATQVSQGAGGGARGAASRT